MQRQEIASVFTSSVVGERDVRGKRLLLITTSISQCNILGDALRWPRGYFGCTGDYAANCLHVTKCQFRANAVSNVMESEAKQIAFPGVSITLKHQHQTGGPPSSTSRLGACSVLRPCGEAGKKMASATSLAKRSRAIASIEHRGLSGDLHMSFALSSRLSMSPTA